MYLNQLNGKIFVISLLNSKERRDHINKEFKRVKLDFEFIDAVNGKEISMHDDSRINYEIVRRSPNWLTPNIVGCCLSHASCYKKVLDENLDFAVIFEDDIIIRTPHFREIIENLLKLSPPESATLLYYQTFKKITLRKNQGIPIGNGMQSYDAGTFFPMSTGGYLIDKKTCENLYKYVFPIHTGPDCWHEFHVNGGIKNLRIVYPIPFSTRDFQSTVTNIQIQGKSNLLKTIVPVINKYKIPPFYQILQLRRNLLKKKFQNIELTE